MATHCLSQIMYEYYLNEAAVGGLGNRGTWPKNRREQGNRENLMGNMGTMKLSMKK